jgi:hypothetical protein
MLILYSALPKIWRIHTKGRKTGKKLFRNEENICRDKKSPYLRSP